VRLTAYTDYTLRTLMYLAVDRGRPVTIAAIAKAYGISETHLMKVVHQLGVAGDIATVRGRNGGIRLAKAPEAINLGAVIRRTEARAYSKRLRPTPRASPWRSGHSS
jgi:Rrf2 family nitric oxide-sensitive transcriptional repressor